jgi:hypothetical protein
MVDALAQAFEKWLKAPADSQSRADARSELISIIVSRTRCSSDEAAHLVDNLIAGETLADLEARIEKLRLDVDLKRGPDQPVPAAGGLE